jgi:hypothetical protein
MRSIVLVSGLGLIVGLAALLWVTRVPERPAPTPPTPAATPAASPPRAAPPAPSPKAPVVAPAPTTPAPRLDATPADPDAGTPLHAERDEQGREVLRDTDEDGDGVADRRVRTVYHEDGARTTTRDRLGGPKGEWTAREVVRERSDGGRWALSQVRRKDAEGRPLLESRHDTNGDGTPETVVRTHKQPDGSERVISWRDLDKDGVLDKRTVVKRPGGKMTTTDVAVPVAELPD